MNKCRFTVKIIKKVVEIILVICSINVDIDACFMLLIPLKYPLKTDVIDTKNTDGASAIIDNSASGIWRYIFAI